jgi:hypothetical protein
MNLSILEQPVLCQYDYENVARLCLTYKTALKILLFIPSLSSHTFYLMFRVKRNILFCKQGQKIISKTKRFIVSL